MKPAGPFVANLLLFVRALRAAGLAVTHGQAREFSRALEWVNIGSREQVFHTARSLLVHRKEELELFEWVFARFWRSEPSSGRSARGERVSAPGPEETDPPGPRSVSHWTVVAPVADPAELEVEVADRTRTFSNREVLQRKDFSEMSAVELEELRRLILDMRWQASLRTTRRWTADARGARIHLRKVFRNGLSSGGTPLALAWRKRKTKRRPVVLLADISGSMEQYSRIALQFFFGAVHGLGRGDVECFVFGTRLTRITGSLRIRNVDRALQDAASEIVDWSGGTRIGESLGTFNRTWARRTLRRGAVVLIVSDGWERGDISALRREMRHLRHRCHRLIWLNPHAGRSGYEPRVEGVRAVLPYVDDFLPIHNLTSLRALSDLLAQLPARGRPRAALRSATRG